MDPQLPRREDELSEIERRLAGWQPSAEKLDADAMLFAAGRAAGRRGRVPLLWPALCAFLAVQVAGLGIWGLSERAGRLALADRQPQRVPGPSAPPTVVAVLPESSYTPSPDDYFHLRRRVEQDPARELTPLPPEGPQSPGPRPPQPAIFRAGQRNGPNDPQ
jgi:hypothetical protein